MNLWAQVTSSYIISKLFSFSARIFYNSTNYNSSSGSFKIDSLILKYPFVILSTLSAQISLIFYKIASKISLAFVTNVSLANLVLT